MNTIVTALYFITPDNMKEARKANHGLKSLTFKQKLLVEDIDYNYDKYNLYLITTNSPNILHYAHGVIMMDGNTVKNKFNGIAKSLPEPLMSLANIHLQR